jgi:hypothetical protein
MSIVPWPPRKPRRPKKTPELIVDPLPDAIVRAFVADIPGPKNETEAERAARFATQLTEVLSYKPRDSADAMMATHCVLLRLVAEDARRDANRAGVAPQTARKCLRDAKELERLGAEMKHMLARRQSRPLGKMDPALFRSLGLGQFLVPDPGDPIQRDQATSAVIVPLHPAPKLLQ